MKRLVTADIHLSENPRDAYRFDFMAKLPTLAKRHKADEVTILGDLTDQKDRHSAWLVNKVANALHTISKVCPVRVLRGNHDYIDGDTPFFRWLSKVDNIYWINQPIQHDGDLFLPHTYNYERDWDGVFTESYDHIFTHNTFKGAISEHGVEISNGIPLSVLPKDADVISGDVHVPQTIEQVTYVGAPYHIKFGDTYQSRFIVTHPGDRWNSYDIETTNKHLLTAHYNRGKLTCPKMDVRAGDVVKMQIHIDLEHCAQWWEIKETARQLCDKREVTLITASPIIKYGRMTERMQAAQQRSPRQDDATLREFSKARNVDDRTLDVGIKLMNDGE
jgi:DNA repair exonuclease SbcCD nuclease subunit